MSLDSPGHIVEAAFEADLARAHLAYARHVLDAFGDLIPCRVVLIGGGIARGPDGVVLEDERVQGDDLTVTVEDVECQLAGDVRWDGGDVGVDFLLSQHIACVNVVTVP